MKKEPMTLHLSPLIKYALAEKSEKANCKNVNTYINDVLTNHIKKQQEEEKILTEVSEIKTQLEAISQVLELMLNK